MRNQAIFTASRLIAVSNTLAEVEAYLNALATELSTTTLAVEEKADVFTAISQVNRCIGQLRDTLNRAKSQISSVMPPARNSTKQDTKG